MNKPLDKKKESRKREDAIAHDFNGRRVTASGALWNRKGDAKTDVFLFEDKYTLADSYTVATSILLKIQKEALFHGKVPVYRFGQLNTDGFIIMSEFFVDEDMYKFGMVSHELKAVEKSVNFKLKILDDLFRSCDIASVTFGGKNYFMMTYSFFLKNWEKFVIA